MSNNPPVTEEQIMMEAEFVKELGKKIGDTIDKYAEEVNLSNAVVLGSLQLIMRAIAKKTGHPFPDVFNLFARSCSMKASFVEEDPDDTSDTQPIPPLVRTRSKLEDSADILNETNKPKS